MRQAVLSAPKTLEWQERPTPEPGPGEAIVRIRAALTCGTDLKTYRRGHPKLAFGPFGHEASGDISAVGEEVSGFAPGDSVMWVQTAPCGSCGPCRAGRENLCTELTAAMALGAYADFLRLPSGVVGRNLFLKPPQLSYIEAAFLEPVSCIVHGWNVLARAGLDRRPGGEVAIIGAGTIGLLHLAYARHTGFAATVIARHEERLALAACLGATRTVRGGLDSLPPGLAGSFPVVIECGGTVESWQEAVRLAAPGGLVLLFSGLPEGSHVPLDATRIHYQELTVLGSFHFAPADVVEARSLLLAGNLSAKDLISGILPLERLEDAFRLLDARTGFKYALIPATKTPAWT